MDDRDSGTITGTNLIPLNCKGKNCLDSKCYVPHESKI